MKNSISSKKNLRFIIQLQSIIFSRFNVLSPLLSFSKPYFRGNTHSHFISQITFLCYSLITSIGSNTKTIPPPNPLRSLRVSKETILDFAFEIRGERRSRVERRERAPINDVSGRSFAGELRSKRFGKLMRVNYR